MSNLKRIVLAVVAVAPAAAFAAGGHDSVGCTGCHSIHAAKGDIIFAVAPNKADLNPRTKQPYKGATALCLGCHQESNKGGQGYAPIHANLSHPYGLDKVNPKVAKVPAELLDADGGFSCMGCHDPHPSNPYHAYLRVDTNKGAKMDMFCGACHSVKADAAIAAGGFKFFTSMDETAGRTAAKAPAPATAPAKK